MPKEEIKNMPIEKLKDMGVSNTYVVQLKLDKGINTIGELLSVDIDEITNPKRDLHLGYSEIRKAVMDLGLLFDFDKLEIENMGLSEEEALCSIENLGLSEKLKEKLSNASIFYLYDLISISYENIANIEKLNEQDINELRNNINGLGYSLLDDPGLDDKKTFYKK